jgi:hypothetical protein
MSLKTISFTMPTMTKKKRLPKPPKGTKTVRNPSHFLKFVRNEQEKTYRKLMEGDVVPVEPDEDFQQSLDYLMTLTREEDKKAAQTQQQTQMQTQQMQQQTQEQTQPQTQQTQPQMFPQSRQNHTLKQRADPGASNYFDENVSLVFPSTEGPPAMRLAPPVMPQWGCLRNGTLPTYRSWQTTQKNRSPDVLRQTMDLVEQTRPNLMAKQQRTVRKTFRVGKHLSQVSVLVSNKTLRNRVTAKTHEIRQKTIEEVKKYLINKGFVRVGTSAPNDVLRKMYESAQLICGEIQNHNSDNLLFNFLNTT